MTNEELFSKIQSGELPQAGIIRRTGGAQDIVVTTVINGEVVEVPDVDLTPKEDA